MMYGSLPYESIPRHLRFDAITNPEQNISFPQNDNDLKNIVMVLSLFYQGCLVKDRKKRLSIRTILTTLFYGFSRGMLKKQQIITYYYIFKLLIQN